MPKEKGCEGIELTAFDSCSTWLIRSIVKFIFSSPSKLLQGQWGVTAKEYNQSFEEFACNPITNSLP